MVYLIQFFTSYLPPDVFTDLFLRFCSCVCRTDLPRVTLLTSWFSLTLPNSGYSGFPKPRPHTRIRVLSSDYYCKQCNGGCSRICGKGPGSYAKRRLRLTVSVGRKWNECQRINSYVWSDTGSRTVHASPAYLVWPHRGYPSPLGFGPQPVNIKPAADYLDLIGSRPFAPQRCSVSPTRQRPVSRRASVVSSL